MKIIVIGGAIVILLLATLVVVLEPANAPTTNLDLTTPQTSQTDSTIINNQGTTTTFTGTLQAVNTACFDDGECYVEVDGKKVTLIIGWSQETVGSIIGAPSISDLERFVGSPVEVYAKENTDGTYTLYGNTDYYVKVLTQ
jgi:hypothetical protein